MTSLKTLVTGAKSLTKGATYAKAGAKFSFKVRKHAPEILVYSGVAGMVATTIVACKHTPETIETHHAYEAERTRIKVVMDNEPESELAQNRGKHLTINYARECYELVKTQKVAITLGALSIASILAGHQMLRSRHLALVGAYATLQKTYDEYREAVIEAVGEETEAEIRKTIVTDSAKEELDPEKPLSAQVSPNGYSIYARVFDEANPNFERDSSYNRWFIQSQEDNLNNLLRARGYVTLNEAYDALGFPRVRHGWVVGWVQGKGDGIIDFGINRADNDEKIAFINGFEKAVWVDFNVDGYVYDDLPLED